MARTTIIATTATVKTSITGVATVTTPGTAIETTTTTMRVAMAVGTEATGGPGTASEPEPMSVVARPDGTIEVMTVPRAEAVMMTGEAREAGGMVAGSSVRPSWVAARPLGIAMEPA